MVVAYPSKAEGFGLPVLEAMACGAAVLTARRLSLPEVGGDAVAYTEPDADSIGEALRALIDDEAAAGSSCPTRRQERAREFTWEASATAHLADLRPGRRRASTSCADDRARTGLEPDACA